MSFRGEMQRLDPASGRPAPYLGGLSAADLAVSADGRWLAWVAFPEATLWRSRADGSDRLQLTVPPLSVNLPRFSPDGAASCSSAVPRGRRQLDPGRVRDRRRS